MSSVRGTPHSVLLNSCWWSVSGVVFLNRVGFYNDAPYFGNRFYRLSISACMFYAFYRSPVRVIVHFALNRSG